MCTLLQRWTNWAVSWQPNRCRRHQRATGPWSHGLVRLGTVERFGIEGTSSYGAGLARWLRSRGVEVLEVERPKRQNRRRRGKSDAIDAEAAARAVQAGTATAQPKAGDGPIEMLRMLQAARRSAIKARTQAANQLHALVVTARIGTAFTGTIASAPAVSTLASSFPQGSNCGWSRFQMR